MKSTILNGNQIDYDDTGSGAATLVLLSGWCQDHRLFDDVRPHLAEGHRVIRVDWRGHGRVRQVDGDFGYAEQALDVIALADELELEQFIPVSTSHGGWANIELTDRLGPRRVPRSVVIDWIMTPAVADFTHSLQEIQDHKTWITGRQDLFDFWLAGADCQPVTHHINAEMATFDFDMWARSCRVIENAYATFGSPLQRMERLAAPRPITHLYSQPKAPGYAEAQQSFAADHDWFTPVHLEGETHFPTLESPARVAQVIGQFVADLGN